MASDDLLIASFIRDDEAAVRELLITSDGI
jgi:hypothetical protein